MTTSTPPNSHHALWNPNAAACWSLVFSPAFGAFLHARNAESLGRREEAKANKVWFYASIAYFVFVLVSLFFPAIPEAVFQGAGIGLLFGWYFSLGKKQITYVKETYQDQYQRKPWTKPLLIGFGCLAGFMAATVVISLIASSLFGIE